MKQHIIIEHNMGNHMLLFGKEPKARLQSWPSEAKIINYRLRVELTMPKNC